MSETFRDRFPTFKDSATGKAILDTISDTHKKHLRAIVKADNAESRGILQAYGRLANELFGVDLLE